MKKLNKVQLSGQLSRDTEVRYTNGDDPITIAAYLLLYKKERERIMKSFLQINKVVYFYFFL